MIRSGELSIYSQSSGSQRDDGKWTNTRKLAGPSPGCRKADRGTRKSSVSSFSLPSLETLLPLAHLHDHLLLPTRQNTNPPLVIVIQPF